MHVDSFEVSDHVQAQRYLKGYLKRDVIIEIVDRKVHFSSVDAMLKIIDVAMLCLHPLTSERPSMSVVVIELLHALVLEENSMSSNA